MRRLFAAVLLAALLVFVAAASSADTFEIRVVSQTSSTITLGWDPQPGYGYLFSADGQLVSRTNDAARARVKFAKGSASYEVAVIAKGSTGTYPPPAPPPPPPPAAACANGTDDDGDGKVDYPADPGCSGASDTDETDPPPPPPPPPPSGNVFVSPTGNDGNACTAAAPCRTLQRGYAAAAAGNVISVANGSYTGGLLTGAKQVTFTVASGTASVTSDLVLRDLSNATFNGPFVSTVPGEQDWALEMAGGSANLTLNNVSGSHFQIIDCAHNITMNGGSWGGYTNRPWAGDSTIDGDETGVMYACGPAIVTNVTLDGVRFHDVQYVPSGQWGGGHPDCLESHGATQNIVVRNSVFERCGNTFIGTYLDVGNMRGFTVENSLFRDLADSGAGVQIGNKPGWVCQGIVFRYNTYATTVPPLINCPTDPAGGAVYGNIFLSPAACGDAVWSYNLWASGTNLCGPNSFVTTNPGFVSATDFHLAAGAFAVGKGDPSRFPAADFEGTARTSPPDAGYDQR